MGPITAYVFPVDWPGNFWWHIIAVAMLLIGFLLTFVMGFIWYERRLIGFFQVRLGPNRAGPFGLFQTVADMLKALTKEDIIPSAADRVLFWLAPVVAFAPVLMVLAVVPLWPGLALADLNAGLVYLAGVSSLTAIGVFMAGYAARNKYGMIGAMREIAQLVSYEIPLVLALASVAILAGTLSVSGIVEAQTVPYALVAPLGFVVFFIAQLAEINRTPFDLIEADSELLSGYNIEYSGMKFAMLYLVDYSEAVVGSTLTATFFLGGWHGPFLPPVIWLIIKIFAVFTFIIWLRSTLPRLRVDQVMSFAWKYLLPLSLLNLLLVGLQVVFLPGLALWAGVAISLVIALILLLAFTRLFRPGRVYAGG
jgi:NADH-quinone oxidoreductase subunit H